MRGAILLLTSLAFAANVYGQDVWLSLHGGYSAPMSQEFAVGFHAGYNVGGALSAYLNRYLMFELGAGQERFDASVPNYIDADGELVITTGTASLRAYPFPDGLVVPYLKTTLAIHYMKAPQETAAYLGKWYPISGSEQAAKAVGLGGGVEARIGPSGGIFAEAQYFIGYVGRTNMIHIPVRAGMFIRLPRSLQ